MDARNYGRGERPMTTPRSKAKLLLLAPLMTAAAVAAFAGGSTQKAAAEDNDPVAKRERCAQRVSIALLGTSPNQALRDTQDPQSQVDAILKDAAFVERFSRFINSKMNSDPAVTQQAD